MDFVEYQIVTKGSQGDLHTQIQIDGYDANTHTISVTVFY